MGSGDWLGHSRTLKCFLRSHSVVTRAVWLGALSCWKTQPRFIFNALADGRRFSLKISRYMAPFILSFTRISRPSPFAEKQPQSMMFPPPCVTVGMVFCGCLSAFFVLQTRRDEFLPKSPWRRSVLLMVGFVTYSQLSAGHSLGPPVWFWDFCSPILWSFWPHGVRSCVEPQIEGDYQWSCISSIS